jgi:hypothetical protein
MIKSYGRGRLIGLVLFAVTGVTSPSQAASVLSQGHFEEFVASSGCAGSPSCAVSFTAIPAGKTLILSNVSCSITASQTASILALTLTRQGSASILAFLNVGTLLSTGSFRRFVSNTEISKIYVGGQIPRVAVSFTASQAISNTQCYLTGQILP